MTKPVNKAEAERVDQLLRRQEQAIVRQFMDFAKRSTNEGALQLVEGWMRANNIEAVHRFVDGQVQQLANVLGTTFVDAARIEASIWGARFGLLSKAPHSLNLADPNITVPIAERRTSFIKNLTRQQRSVVRTAVIEGMRRGQSTERIARSFSRSIGLTDEQYRAVQRYQSLLEQTSREALSYALRDPRFDERIQRAIDENDVLTAAQIEMMVGRYTENLRQFRAERIAATEALGIVAQARDAAVKQMAGAAGRRKGIKIWATVGDERVRDTHVALEGEVVGIDEAFQSPSGARMLYPGDTSLGAGAREIVNCRCSVQYEYNVEEEQ